jgi:hypothetical protein
LDIPAAAGKNLRTQIWGGKDRGLMLEKRGSFEEFFQLIRAINYENA